MTCVPQGVRFYFERKISCSPIDSQNNVTLLFYRNGMVCIPSMTVVDYIMLNGGCLLLLCNVGFFQSQVQLNVVRLSRLLRQSDMGPGVIAFKLQARPSPL